MAEQYHLGVAYLNGSEGVTRDYKEAAKWFSKAANQEHVEAQYHLGLLYSKGKGTIQNYMLAHMWFNLAASNGSERAVIEKDKVSFRMTKAQVEQAQKLAMDWKPKKASWSPW